MRYFYVLLLLVFSSISTASSHECVENEATSPTQCYFVGELGESWQFPSDHLPIGATVGQIHVAMWNILDTGALHHIVGNGQGLRDSLIMTANVPASDGSTLTLRESLILKNVMEMITHQKFPRSVLALQETSEEVFKELQRILPNHMKLIPTRVEDVGHGDIFIYDTDLLELLEVQVEHYAIRSHNTIMVMSMRERKTGLTYHFIQSHVPGGPVFSAPAREQLANTVMRNFDPHAITILMGDMNRSPDDFLDNFAKATCDYSLQEQPFTSLAIPYPTHINTHQEASWIDNLFIANPFSEIDVSVASDASELFEDLQPTLNLLKRSR